MPKCLIIGGGIVGLSSALVLDRLGFEVVLIDKHSLALPEIGPEYCPRVYAINPRSEHFFTQLNVWPSISQQRLCPYQRMKVWDGPSRHHIEFDCRDVGQAHLGHIIEESVIKRALLERIQDTSITLAGNTALDWLDIKATRLGNAQQDWHGDYILGVDGANSWTREQLNASLTHWDYHHHAIICHAKCEKPHAFTARQIFTPQGPLAFLPMPDEHSCSIVWSTQKDYAQHVMNMDEQAFCQALTKAFQNHLGAITSATTRHSFPLRMRHVKQLTGPNWLLLGDAAHTIHPLAGQGVNLGLNDVIQLAELLGRDWSPKKLQHYQRHRKTEVWAMIAAMEGFKRFFEAQTLPGLDLIRGLGLKTCNQLSPLKRLLMSLASGEDKVVIP